jgi:hypothetical protein
VTADVPINLGYLSLPANVQAEAEQAALPPEPPPQAVVLLRDRRVTRRGMVSGIVFRRYEGTTRDGWAIPGGGPGDHSYTWPELCGRGEVTLLVPQDRPLNEAQWCPSEYVLCRDDDRRCILAASHVEDRFGGLHMNRGGFAWDDQEAVEAAKDAAQ